MPNRYNLLLETHREELLRFIDSLSLDELILLTGKLETLLAAVKERALQHDPNYPHRILPELKARWEEHSLEGDRLLDAKEASKQLGFSVRWLYTHADELPFTRRQKTGRLRFSKYGIDEWLRQQPAR